MQFRVKSLLFLVLFFQAKSPLSFVARQEVLTHTEPTVGTLVVS